MVPMPFLEPPSNAKWMNDPGRNWLLYGSLHGSFSDSCTSSNRSSSGGEKSSHPLLWSQDTTPVPYKTSTCGLWANTLQAHHMMRGWRLLDTFSSALNSAETCNIRGCAWVARCLSLASVSWATRKSSLTFTTNASVWVKILE
mgnify:CR=1 FL=1